MTTMTVWTSGLTRSENRHDTDRARRSDCVHHGGPAQAGAYSSDTMPAGSTRVTVTLQDAGGDTLLTLRHDDLPTSELRDAHRIAWQTYLTRLAVRASGADPGADPHAATPSDALPLILWTGAVGYIRFHIYVDRPMVLAVFEQRVSGILVTWRLRTRAGR
jgi:hypothetical protein